MPRARRSVIAQRLRHIDIRMHRTRQAIDDGDIKIVKVATETNRADGFTKALPRSKFVDAQPAPRPTQRSRPAHARQN
jgi:hypothetical protein